jgi:hypothetical protein
MANPPQLFRVDRRLHGLLLHIRPWSDDVVEKLGFHPRSSYVEDFWLGILGPSTTWLLRRLAAGFEYSPDGFALNLAETARSLGLGDRSGQHSPSVRSINRTVQFGLAQVSGPEELSVRRRLPPLNRAQLLRLHWLTGGPGWRTTFAALRQARHDYLIRAAGKLSYGISIGEWSCIGTGHKSDGDGWFPGADRKYRWLSRRTRWEEQ